MERNGLIVGLGNQGERYANTRHNIGFRIVDKMALMQKELFQHKKELKGDIARIKTDRGMLTLLKPSTMMNGSGLAVKKTADTYQISVERILIISDDAEMPLGRLRLRSSGSCGGHNGLRSVEELLGTRDYYRLKVGVGRDPDLDLADYVLSPFTSEQQRACEEIIEEAALVATAFFEGGYQTALERMAALRSKK